MDLEPGKAWSGWYSLGSASGATLASNVAVGYVNGYEELFARASDGSVWHNYLESGNTWSGWYSLGGSPSTTLSSDVGARARDSTLDSSRAQITREGKAAREWKRVRATYAARGPRTRQTQVWVTPPPSPKRKRARQALRPLKRSCRGEVYSNSPAHQRAIL